MRIAIIGNGVAGITAARFLRKGSDAEITVISDEAPYHFSRPAMMYVSMGHMTFEQTKPYEDWFWTKNRISLRAGRVSTLTTTASGLTIAMEDGHDMPADVVVIATGSRPALPGWPGIDLGGVQSYVHASDLDSLERNLTGARHGVVIGGGLIGVEAAEILHARGLRTTFLVREPAMYRKVFPEPEARLISDHIAAHGIDLRCSTEVDAILPRHDDPHRVGGVQTVRGDVVSADVVVVATGVRPNVDLAQASGIAVDRGIVVDDRFRTSMPGVFAIGDCAQHPHGVDQLWYTARLHGEHAARVILGADVPYDAGVYFNSAKFFDLEWQVYGHVPATSNAVDSHVWIDRTGARMVRITLNGGRVCGMHAIGVRLRQDVCSAWIEGGATLDEVRRDFAAAVFDQEFSREVTI
jgi:NAD(P)H-nitrite reductase large subunit